MLLHSRPQTLLFFILTGLLLASKEAITELAPCELITP